MESRRLDTWLWYARFFKSRSLATRVCSGGRIRINGKVVRKAHHSVRPGDVLTFPKGHDIRVVRVLDPGSRRGPAPESTEHHHENFVTREWNPAAGTSCAEIEAALTSDRLLRAKGFVATAEGKRLVQVVGRRIEITTPDVEPPAELLGRIVLIERA